MGKNRSYRLGWVIPFGALILWYIGTTYNWWNAYIVPPPQAVWNSACELCYSGLLWRHIYTSLYRVIVGFLLAFIVAFPLGIVLSLKPSWQSLLGPTLEFFRNVPPLAMLPILILWFGIGETSKLIIVILATFFPIFLNTLEGMTHYDNNLLEVGTVFGYPPHRLFWHIRLPQALPFIFVGIRLGFGYSWRSLIGAEMIAAASGLGYMILDGEEMARPEIVVLGIFVIGIMGILTDWLIRCAMRRFSPYLNGRLSHG